LGGEATDDECIELAEALERLRAIKIVEAVMNLPIGGATAIMPTPFQAGYQLACEEITHRLQTEEWELNLPPNVELRGCALLRSPA
jgi:hypothetical protein